jgi:hypothetical protein
MEHSNPDPFDLEFQTKGFIAFLFAVVFHFHLAAKKKEINNVACFQDQEHRFRNWMTLAGNA